MVRAERAEVRRHRDRVVRIVLGRDEVQRLAHEGCAYDGTVVQSVAQIVPLETLKPSGERDVGRARTLALERAEAVDSGRDVERDAVEQELARQCGAVQLAATQPAGRRRYHGSDGTTCACGDW